jgi:squalene-associated FAD-dependent desaturase
MAAGSVAVVGAGLAGLSAGLALKRAGFAVDVYERSRLLGGKVTSFEVGGIEVDNGQHVYLGCCTAFVDFVRQLHPLLSPEVEPLYQQERFTVLLLARGAKPARLSEAPLPAPLQFAPALLRYRHLSPRSRAGVAAAILAARRPARPGETFAAWLTRHHQPADARVAFWEPFLVPALNAPLDQVSAEAALFVVSTAFLGPRDAARFGYALVPLARIAEAAATQLDRVQLRTPVTGVEPAASGAGVEIVLDGGPRLAYDGVVLAVPPERLARLLGDPDAYGLVGLDAFRMSPIVDVHLWYDIPGVGFDFAAILDSPVQWVFEKAPGYLCCSMSAADRHISTATDDLVALCHAELSAVLPQLRGYSPLRGAATRDREATFIPAPGLRRPGPRTTNARIAIAGAWTDTGWPATMESAVLSGRAAAAALTESLQTLSGDREVEMAR